MVRIPTATNTVVVNFEQLAANVRDPAVDVILLDTTFWGGIRPCVKAAGVCETFQLGVAVHSSGELGIQLATMLHLGAVLPNLTFAADAHYHHLTDDIIAGGKMEYGTARSRVPDGPGPRRRARSRQARASTPRLYRELGGYPYDRDPQRPGWFALVPNTSGRIRSMTEYHRCRSSCEVGLGACQVGGAAAVGVSRRARPCRKSAASRHAKALARNR